MANILPHITAYIKHGLSEFRTTCPDCSETRRNFRDRCLSVTVKEERGVRSAVYCCHHCGLTGGVNLDQRQWEAPVKKITRSIPDGMSEDGMAFMRSRGIGPEIVKRYGVFSETRWFRDHGEQPAIGFPYLDEGKPYAVKYRGSKEKLFTQEGAAATLFGIEKVTGDMLIITEGELDALSLAQAGFTCAVSVPGGANIKAGEGDKSPHYLYAAKPILDLMKKIVVFVDADKPGEALGEELSRRLGRHRCWRVTPPEGCKDANDVLLKFGPDRLRNVVNSAEPWPVAGLYQANKYRDKVMELYKTGFKSGLSTGLMNVDELFTVFPGMLTVVTGHPGSGKSDWVDQVVVNLAVNHDWRFAVWSVENPPAFHISKLVEKIKRMPFREGLMPRMTERDLSDACDFVEEHFAFMEQAGGEAATIDSILERAAAAVLRNGAKGLIIDPFNYIDIGNPDSETRAISDMLTKVRVFAQQYDVHVWFVAHPRKMIKENGKLPIADGTTISGSAAWWAKADIGVTVTRDWESDRVDISAWKVRFKWIGKIGTAELRYDVPTGCYRDWVMGRFDSEE